MSYSILMIKVRRIPWKSLIHRSHIHIIKVMEVNVKESKYKSYDELPLFLNAETVAKVLGVSPSSGYELMHEADFPVLKVGNRMVVPKEKFVEWVDQHTKGSGCG